MRYKNFPKVLKDNITTDKEYKLYLKQNELRINNRLFKVGDVVETKEGFIYPVVKIDLEGIWLGGETDFLFKGDYLKNIC